MNLSMNQRNIVFDAIKGVAILLIVITHFNWTDSERMIYGFPFWIDTAMPVFMTLSGYLYAQSFDKHSAVKLKDAYELPVLLKNLLRFILPFALLAPLDVLCGVAKTGNVMSSIKHLALGGFGPGSYYVPMMLQFALIFPLLFVVVRKYKRRGVMLLLAFNVAYEWGCSLLEMPVWMSSSAAFNLLGYRILIARYVGVLGLAIYLSQNKCGMKTSLTLMIGGGMWLVSVCYGGYKPLVFQRWVTTCLPAALFSVGLIMMILRFLQPKHFPDCIIPLVGVVGKSTYEIFLVQKLFYAMPFSCVMTLCAPRTIQLTICLLTCFIGGLLFRSVFQWVYKVKAFG